MAQRKKERKNPQLKGRPGGRRPGTRMTRDLKDEGWVARGFYLSRRDDEELDEVAQRAGVSCGYILRQLVSDFLDRRIKILWPED